MALTALVVSGDVTPPAEAGRDTPITSTPTGRLRTEGGPGAGGALSTGTDKSGAIATGGQAQQLAAANANRLALRGQNRSVGDIWINETGGTAAPDAAGSFRISPNLTFDIQTRQAVSVYGDATGQAWTATET